VDLVSRLPGEPIKAALGQPVIVENRLGAIEDVNIKVEN
jgi:tripartite-type tricarboxylate transporter receptor subunit TctC